MERRAVHGRMKSAGDGDVDYFCESKAPSKASPLYQSRSIRRSPACVTRI